MPDPAAPPPPRPPAIVAVRMGYGHLRPAHALAQACGGEVVECDQAPLATDWERRVWDRCRNVYETLSPGAGAHLAGFAIRGLLDGITSIPRPGRPGSRSKTNRATRYVASLTKDGLGRGLLERLQRDGTPLLTTFYAPAVVADAAGLDATCVVTDVDVNRVWVPPDAAASRARSCVPARRTARRLLAYGVNPRLVPVTGFPLQPSLTGCEDLAVRDRLLANRLRRLDPAGAFAREASPAARRLLAEADP